MAVCLFEHFECHGDDIIRMDIMQFEIACFRVSENNLNMFNIYILNIKGIRQKFSI